MKILLLGNYVPDGQESMQRFANVLCQQLRLLNHEVELIRPKIHLGAQQITNSFEKWLGYIDKYLLFPQQLRRKLSWADVVHICDHSNSIYVRYLKNIQHIITCHDLLAVRCALGEFPNYKPKWTGLYLQKMIFRGLQRSQKIVAISMQTQKDIKRLLKPCQKIPIISMGLNYPYAPMEKSRAKKKLQELGLCTRMPFFLHVGGNQWYKNRLGMLHIFWHLQRLLKEPCYLVAVGKPFTLQMQSFVASHNLKNVVELVHVSNENLCALYSMAKALIFPSLEEGFGWPIIEAQACGCVVVTSNKPPINDIGGKAAIYIHPDHPKQAAQQIAVGLENCKNIREEAISNAQRFSIENMANLYAKLYQNLI